MDKYGTPADGFTIVCTTYRLTEHYHYWTKNNPMNVQLVPEPFVEIPVQLAADLGIKGGDKVKVTSARASYQAKAMVTHRIKPMTIDGKKVYQIGIPIHYGYRGIQEDAGRTARSLDQLTHPHRDDPNAHTPEFKGFLSQTGESVMSNGPLQIKAISGHAGPVPGLDTSRDYSVAKLIDVTTCIGCKACEVACLEWNGYPFRETVFDNTYQTMPDTAWNYYNLIRFNEHVDEAGNLSWLMRKDGCMHCADPGCLRACPSDGAIVQYANGIVDFKQDNASAASIA
jgi:ferredoxin